MRRFLVSAAAAAGIVGAFLATPSVAQQQQQQSPPDELRATHGDWDVRCIMGTDTCAMQQVGETADGRRALLVTVQRLEGATTDEGQAVPAQMTVQTPLGILIGYGVRLKVDTGPVVPVPLTVCVPAGCVASAPMREEAVDMMKKGSTATFVFALQQEVPVDVSLNGFTAAYNSLKPIRPGN